MTVATAPAAGAHPLPTRSLVPVGKPGTVTIGIPSEATVAMTGVDIRVPRSYRVIKLEPPPGWMANFREGQIHFSHGKVAPGSFALFSFRGEASKRGPLKFSLVIRSADGHSQLWDGVQGKDPYPAPVVYAGVPAPAASDAGPNVALLAGWGLIALGVGAAVWRVLRRRRVGRAGLQTADQVGTSASHP